MFGTSDHVIVVVKESDESRVRRLVEIERLVDVGEQSKNTHTGISVTWELAIFKTRACP